jgi:lipopolysaccharide export system permease protein
MQFLWKYVDDLMGKGLEWYIIVELLYYASANLVPMALPLAILLSSIMTFGTLAENSELVAMKSSGLSLFRIMYPLIIIMMLTSASAFYFSNYLWPVANLELRALIYDVTEQKPMLNLKEGVFYNDFEKYSIKAGKKHEDNSLEDVYIYDHTNPNPNFKRSIWAKKGRMAKTKDGKFLKLTLHNGSIYEEVNRDDADDLKVKTFPHRKYHFEEMIFRLNLEDFQLKRTNQDLFKKGHEMLNLSQLHTAIDSLEKQYEKRKQDYYWRLRSRSHLYVGRVKADLDTFKTSTDFYSRMTPTLLRDALDLSKKKVRDMQKKVIGVEGHMAGYMHEFANRQGKIWEHKIEWHRKLTLSFACFILFFVGAPLGAIIKKGGLGLPVVFAVLFFLAYHIISISGEKMAITGVVPPYLGMWLSSLILFPIGVFLTYKAATDSVMFDRNTYRKIMGKIPVVKLLVRKRVNSEEKPKHENTSTL